MNVVLNTHWKDISKTLKPSVRLIMGDLISEIWENLANIVSVDEYFKE